MLLRRMTLFSGLLAGAPLSASAADSVVEYIQVESEALGRAVPVGVYLPPGYDDAEDQRYPVLYFLHGMFGDQRKWESRGCPELLDEMIEQGKAPPMIVVSPSGERSSFWVNWVSGRNNWEDFVVRDLVAAVDAKYRTLPDRGHRGITGDSMGGYGALNLGFKHAKLFGSISAHSAMLYPVNVDEIPQRVMSRAEHFGPIYGAPVDADHWRRNHPVHLAGTLDEAQLKSLHIYFDCGADDRYGFADGARKLAEVLTERGVPHEAEIRKGNHGSDYFRKYVPYSIEFHGRSFRNGAPGSETDQASPEPGESKPKERKELPPRDGAAAGKAGSR